jgi:hypothetical protein
MTPWEGDGKGFFLEKPTNSVISVFSVAKNANVW